LDDGVLAVSVGEFDGFAGSLAEKIEFCPPCLSASNGPDIDNIWRMEREDSLDTFTAYNPADGEGFVDAAAFAGDYRAGKYLKALLVAFSDSAVYVHRVAYFEMRYILFQAFTFNGIQHLCFHWFISFYGLQ
jgi:hypothetical protein